MPDNSRFHEYARIGATARLAELQAEIDSIRAAFPDVDATHKSPGRPKRSALAALMDPAPQRKRRKMSAAAKKAISEAQKKRWAAFRAK